MADIPETEMFSRDRNRLVAKFASSAANVAGKPLASSETGTWLKEHFTETLADVKGVFDDMLLSGINHMFYHGTCYSPDRAGWPGWVFYASLEMNPRNSIWHDVPAVNAYAARCQSVLQSSRPDNDILLYWPIHDLWNNPRGLVQSMTVHARDWFEDQPIGKTAQRLWDRGYGFDYVSDRQLAAARTVNGQVQMPGGRYQAVVIPSCHLMPVETLRALLELAKSGATLVFDAHLPDDVPGWGDLASRRKDFQALLATAKAGVPGNGRIIVGETEAAVANAGIRREPMFEHSGLMCVRRAFPGGWYYFIANRSEQAAVDAWVTLGSRCRSIVLMDPWTGRTGRAAVRHGRDGTKVYLQVGPGESVVLRCFEGEEIQGADWAYWRAPAAPLRLGGNWQVKFLEGGPKLPGKFNTAQLGSWAQLPDTNAQRFAGTARYTLRFDAPIRAAQWRLGLGSVAQSARVRVNGQDCGTAVLSPFSFLVGPLKLKNNLLEVEVANVSANRIRDLDRRGVPWKNFHDINFVNLDYKPFDASHWPLTDSGLIGPVTLCPLERLDFRQN